ncbi:MAG: AAA family ATPase, partial [Kiritimatiellae bacterium]|nr:AAA family ATPase [Kiritimatiellia bacterium]
MLVQLSVRNLAIVEEAVVTFGNGLNIITGETGAGKSVLMGALHLVLGGRSDKSAIREGAPEARVEASFLLNDTAAIDAILEEAGLPLCEENLLLVRRTVNQNGGGRCFINDGSATAQTLRKVGELLVDIHGPYDHQSLLDEAFQRDLLDAYGGCGALRDAYRTAWREEAALKQRLQALQGDSADIAQEIDRLQFAVDEIRQAGLSEADEEELVQRHDQAANAERILDLGGSAMNALMEGEGSIFDQLVGIQN